MTRQKWSSVQFYSEGDLYFSAVLEEIRKAQVSVKLETYIFSLDPLTEKILEELRQASLRKVKVQVLVDGFGSYFWIDGLRRKCQQNGIELRVFHPIPSHWNLALKFLRLLRNRVPFIFKKINRRNHRKLILVDDHCAFLGSFNITQVHSAQFFGSLAWKDFGVRLQGSPLIHLERAFRHSWTVAEKDTFLKKLSKGRHLKRYDPLTQLVRINTTRKLRSLLKRDLLKRILSAQNTIQISSAYFLPRPRLLKALAKAAERGVVVEIILPGKSDAPIVKWASLRVLQTLLKAGVRFYEYQPSVLHSKFMIIDGRFATLGSSNFNHRSLLHDLELEACFEEVDQISFIQKEFEKEKRSSRQISASQLQLWPWYLKIASRIAYRLRYLL